MRSDYIHAIVLHIWKTFEDHETLSDQLGSHVHVWTLEQLEHWCAHKRYCFRALPPACKSCFVLASLSPLLASNTQKIKHSNFLFPMDYNVQKDEASQLAHRQRFWGLCCKVCIFEVWSVVCIFEVCSLWSAFSRSVFWRHSSVTPHWPRPLKWASTARQSKKPETSVRLSNHQHFALKF